jgi:hypothetical protein
MSARHYGLLVKNTNKGEANKTYTGGAGEDGILFEISQEKDGTVRAYAST